MKHKKRFSIYVNIHCTKATNDNKNKYTLKGHVPNTVYEGNWIRQETVMVNIHLKSNLKKIKNSNLTAILDLESRTSL